MTTIHNMSYRFNAIPFKIPISFFTEIEKNSQALSNSSYSGGRDQEDCGSKTAQANSS
jgi:hypothetical protein